MSNGEGGSGLNTENADQAIQGQLEGTSQLNQDFAVGVERRKEQLKIETEITKALQLQFETTKKNLDFQQETIVQLGAQAKKLAESNASIEEQKKLLENIRSQYNQIADDNGISEDLQRQINESLRQTEPDLKEIAKLMEKVRGEMEQTKDFTRDVDTNFSKFSKTLGMTEDFADTGLGKMNKFFIELQTGNTEKKVEVIVDKFMDFLNPLNIVANLLGEIINQAFKLEEASISFSKATGFTRDFDNEIVNVASNITMAGGTIDDASKSLGDLAKNMSSFKTLSEGAMKSLATLDFRLKQIGVTNASKMFDIFSRNLGKGSEEAERLTRELILSGTAAGITASEMGSNFESAFKDLAVNGSRATEVFKDLAAQAKAAGVAISDLTALGKDFDTFDKGAEKAAKLNAMLGTQISHMQMLHMSDEQRSMEMIRQIKMAVGNFDALSRSEKLYVAQAIAGGDVAKAQRLINMNTSEYLAKKDQMAAAAKTQEDLKNMTEQLVPAIDKLKMAFLQVALQLSFVIEGFTKLLNIVSYLAPVISAIVVALTTYFLVSKAIILIQGIYNTLQDLAAARDLLRQTTLKGLAFYTELAALMNIKFNFSMMSTIGIVAAVAAGIAYLVYVMTTTNSPPFYLIFGVVAFGVTLFSSALNSMSPKAMVAAVVLALLAAAVSLIFYGIGYLVEQMVAFVSVMAEAPMAFLNAATGVYALAGAMTALTLSTIGFRFGAFIDFANSMENLGDGLQKYADGIERLKSVAGEISSAMGDTTMIGTVEGGKSTVALGKNAAIASVFTNDKLVVDIQMPEINFPTPVVHVYIDGVAISDAVMDVIMETQ